MDQDKEWRERWAAYFEARAAKSMANAAAREPDQVKVKAWLDTAGAELSCAIMLRSGESLEALHAALADIGPVGG
jgi:hypothetical protein